jgi:hypothetical protein
MCQMAPSRSRIRFRPFRAHQALREPREPREPRAFRRALLFRPPQRQGLRPFGPLSRSVDDV